jgi:anthranilate synthase/aminodeoxychorismate synthase-like glutamine amidotransferase
MRQPKRISVSSNFIFRMQVVLSPGPGNPSDFGLSKTLALMEKLRIPAFGVCLGLQGMVEHFGGELGILSYPMHGKPSPVFLTEAGNDVSSIFDGLPSSFEVARYHSLHGLKDKMPSCLEITALTEDGIVMGIKHKTLPFAAVQFHPESILTSPNQYDRDEVDHPAYPDATVVDSNLPLSDLKRILKAAGLTISGTKDELTQKLLHWVGLRDQYKNGNLLLEQMSVNQLKDLKHALGLKGTTVTKDQLIESIRNCLTNNGA